MSGLTHSKNQKGGFTLVEILVAMGLASMLALGLASVMNSSARGSKTMVARAEVTDYGNVLQQILNVTGNCTATYTAAGNLSPSASIPNPIPSTLKIDVKKVLVENPTTGAISTFYNSTTTPPPIVPGIVGSTVAVSLQNFTNIGPQLYTASLVLDVTLPTTMNRADVGFIGGNNLTRSMSVTISTNSSTPPIITGCNPKPACLTGWSLVGTAGTNESFCISAEQPPHTLFPYGGDTGAEHACEQFNSHICSVDEWLYACNTLGASFDSATPQWIAPVWTGGCSPVDCYMRIGGGCTTGVGGAGYNNATTFRCCQR